MAGLTVVHSVKTQLHTSRYHPASFASVDVALRHPCGPKTDRRFTASDERIASSQSLIEPRLLTM